MNTKKYVIKFISGIISFCMILNMLPFTAIPIKAATIEADYTLAFHEGKMKKGGTSGAAIDGLAGWSYNSTSKTLTLTDFDFCASVTAAGTGTLTIYDEDVTLELKGTNKLEHKTTGSYGNGLYCPKGITITGDGTLHAIGYSTAGAGVNVSPDTTFRMISGTVTGECRSPEGDKGGSGVKISSTSVIIEGGILRGIAEPSDVSSSKYSYGVWLYNTVADINFQMTGGTVYGKGNDAAIAFNAANKKVNYSNIALKGKDESDAYTVVGEFSKEVWYFLSQINNYSVPKGTTDPYYYPEYKWLRDKYPTNPYWDGSAEGKPIYIAAVRAATIRDGKLYYAPGSLTINPNGGTYNGDLTYRDAESTTIEITAPTRDGYIFSGWTQAGSGSFADTIYTLGNSAGTLTAQWTKKKQADVNDNTSAPDFTVTAPNLDTVLDRVATSADIAGDNTVTLSLNVTDVNNQTVETEAIKTAADKGSEVYFFDVTLKKTVNDGFSTTDTTLTNIPVPVEVHIALTGDLAGKSYYKVYRYHNGVAEQISNDTSKSEHYVVDVAGSEIIIYTMKFSTYAIFGNDTTLQNLDENEEMDVQAKITDNSIGIYKVDISWGAMAFEWDTSGKTYDPDTHEWTVAAGGSWAVSSHNGVNNKITCANHSNGSLLASFDVAGTLNGVDYDVFTTNENTGAVAVNMPLSKVPNETANAPIIEAFLRLDGEPDSADLSALGAIGNDEWLKIGVITVTFEPDMMDLEKTPRN